MRTKLKLQHPVWAASQGIAMAAVFLKQNFPVVF